MRKKQSDKTEGFEKKIMLGNRTAFAFCEIEKENSQLMKLQADCWSVADDETDAIGDAEIKRQLLSAGEVKNCWTVHTKSNDPVRG